MNVTKSEYVAAVARYHALYKDVKTSGWLMECAASLIKSVEADAAYSGPQPWHAIRRGEYESAKLAYETAVKAQSEFFATEEGRWYIIPDYQAREAELTSREELEWYIHQHIEHWDGMYKRCPFTDFWHVQLIETMDEVRTMDEAAVAWKIACPRPGPMPTIGEAYAFAIALQAKIRRSDTTPTAAVADEPLRYPASYYKGEKGIPPTRLEKARRGGRLTNSKLVGKRWHYVDGQVRNLWPEDFIEITPPNPAQPRNPLKTSSFLHQRMSMLFAW